MKPQVIEALKGNASNPKKKFAELFELYRKHPHATFQMNRHFNAAGYSPTRLQTLEYEVMKVYDIKPKELHSAKMKKPVIILTGEERLLKVDFSAPVDVIKQELKDLTEFSKLDELLPTPLPIFVKGAEGSKVMKQWLVEKEVQHTFTRKADLLKIVEETQARLTAHAYDEAFNNLNKAQQSLLDKPFDLATVNAVSELFVNAPEEVKQSIKLRDQFQFLGEEDCPNEFKILVADKYTAYNNFLETRAEVKDLVAAGATNEDLFEVAKKAVENYELNLDIYDELNYYNEHKEILGKHPIFEKVMLQKKVNGLSGVDLGKRQATLRANISRDNKKLEDKKVTAAKKENFVAKLEGFKSELVLVDARIAKTKAANDKE